MGQEGLYPFLLNLFESIESPHPCRPAVDQKSTLRQWIQQWKAHGVSNPPTTTVSCAPTSVHQPRPFITQPPTPFRAHPPTPFISQPPTPFVSQPPTPPLVSPLTFVPYDPQTSTFVPTLPITTMKYNELGPLDQAERRTVSQ